MMRGAREILLTAGAVLGLVCILATVVGYAFGITPLVFRSGSMSPAIHTGDLAVARTVDAASLETGDIVSVVNAEGNRVTHRLLEMTAEGKARRLTLQGDANRAPDAEVYTATRVERVLLDIPKAGYVVDAAAGPAGLFVLGAYVAGMLVLAFRRPPPGTDAPAGPRRGGARKAARGSRVAARTAAFAVLGTTLAVAPPASAAFWTNGSPVTGTAFTTYTLPAPATFTCGGLGLFSVTFNWAAVSGATSYTLHYGSGGATTKTVTGTSTSITSAISGGTAWIVANRSFASTTWSSGASNTRGYTVAVVSLCS
jgi:signal peptidase I